MAIPGLASIIGFVSKLYDLAKLLGAYFYGKSVARHEIDDLEKEEYGAALRERDLMRDKTDEELIDILVSGDEPDSVQNEAKESVSDESAGKDVG